MKPKITASYSGGAISVNWSASNAASDTTFTVTMSSPNGSEQLASGAGAGGKTISNPAAGATYSFTVTTNTGESASSSVKSLIHQIKLPKIILLSLKMTEQRTIIKMKTIATLIKTTALIKVTIHLLSRMITKTAIMAAIVTVAIAVITAIPIITITIAAILTMVITTIITEAQLLLQQTTVEVTQEVKHHKLLLHHRRRQHLLHRSKSQQLKINVAVKAPTRVGALFLVKNKHFCILLTQLIK